MKLSAGSLITGALLVSGLGGASYLAFLSPAASPQGVSGVLSTATHRAPSRGRPSTPVAKRVEVVAELGWGSGPDQLGHLRPREASAEGPMSFAVDAEGRAFVLDQVNGRVVVLERGAPSRTIDLPTNTYQDLAVDAQGGLVLLDRLVSRSLLFLSKAGQIRHQIALEGQGVPDGGSVTALFARPDGAWVEVDHGVLIRVAHEDGSPDEERPAAPGRFGAADGQHVRALLGGPQMAEVATVSREGVVAPFGRVEWASDVLQLCALEVDAQGRVFLGASLYREEPEPPYPSQPIGDQIVMLGPDGIERARVLFPGNTGPEEQFRNVRLGDDGALYHLGLSAEGATLRRFVP